MTLTKKLIIGILGMTAVIWMFGAGARRSYFQPHETLTNAIAAATERNATYTSALAKVPGIEKQLDSFVNRTLGGDLESVDHRLRARLNRIAEQLELTDIAVSTGRAVARQTPAKRKFSRRDRELRDEIDFVELSSWITVTASLGQALNLLDRIEAEPWIKRIDQFTLDPKDNGETFSATVRLTTLFLPGREPGERESPPYDLARVERFVSLVNLNPFRIPDIETPISPAPAPADTPGQWVITGIAEGPDGPEVWLLNNSSGAAKILLPGETFENVTLISTQDDRAVFQFQSSQYIILIGGNLNDRSRPKQ